MQCKTPTVLSIHRYFVQYIIHNNYIMYNVLYSLNRLFKHRDLIQIYREITTPYLFHKQVYIYVYSQVPLYFIQILQRPTDNTTYIYVSIPRFIYVYICRYFMYYITDTTLYTLQIIPRPRLKQGRTKRSREVDHPTSCPMGGPLLVRPTTKFTITNILLASNRFWGGISGFLNRSISIG